MTTKLDGSLKRELVIGGEPYTLTIDPRGLKLTPKARRKGYELDWEAFISGEAALATALNASLAKAPQQRATAGSKPAPRKRKRRAA